MLDKEGECQAGGRPINPSPIGPNLKVAELVDSHFNAYNAARLREACLIYSKKILRDDVSIGVGVSGALPLLAAYLLSSNPSRVRRRLYEQRDETVAALMEIYVSKS